MLLLAPVGTFGHFRNLGAEFGGTENVLVREYLVALVQAILVRFPRINSKLKLSGSAQVTRHNDEYNLGNDGTKCNWEQLKASGVILLKGCAVKRFHRLTRHLPS